MRAAFVWFGTFRLARSGPWIFSHDAHRGYRAKHRLSTTDLKHSPTIEKTTKKCPLVFETHLHISLLLPQYLPLLTGQGRPTLDGLLQFLLPLLLQVQLLLRLLWRGWLRR